MKLLVETVAAHQDLLLTSLPDRLAPRWQLLSSIASKQADFKAEDHLAALAILSDQAFAQAFRAHGEQNRMWQSNNAACLLQFPFLFREAVYVPSIHIDMSQKQI